MYLDNQGYSTETDNLLKGISGLLIVAGLVIATVCTGGAASLVAKTIMGLTTIIAGTLLLAETTSLAYYAAGILLTFGGGFLSGSVGYITHQLVTGSKIRSNEVLLLGTYGMIIAPFFTFGGIMASGLRN